MAGVALALSAAGVAAERVPAPVLRPQQEASDWVGAAAPVPDQPWYDTSGEKKVVVRAKLALEVSGVAVACDRIRRLVTACGGYLVADSRAAGIMDRRQAQVLARVPAGRYRATLSGIMALGRAVSLTGAVTEVTDEYYARGAIIRQLAYEEARVMQELASAPDEDGRRHLRGRINALRTLLREHKEPLEGLARDAHLARLEISLTTATGSPGLWPWAAAAMVFVVPIAIIAMLVRRRRSRR